MPYKSQAQVGKFFHMEAAGELPQGTARRWAHHTPDMKHLPKRAPKRTPAEAEKTAGVTRADQLHTYAQNLPPLVARTNKVASNPPGSFSPNAIAGTSVSPKMAGQNPQLTAKSTSVLDDQPERPAAEAEGLRDFTEADLTQVFDQARLRFQNKLSAFTPFTLPNGRLLDPCVTLLTKHAALPMSPMAAQPAAAPTTVQQAHQQMQAVAPVGAPPQAGAGPLLNTPPTSGQQAAAVPGLPGMASTNVIDMRGGLDATGQMVDGNHGAGVAKGFKMAAELPAWTGPKPLASALKVRSGVKPFDPIAFNLGVPQEPAPPPAPIQQHLGKLHSENTWLSDVSRMRRADVVGRMVPEAQQRAAPEQLGQHPAERMNSFQAGHPPLPEIPSGGAFAPGALPGPSQPATPQPTSELWDMWHQRWDRLYRPQSQPAGNFTAVPGGAALKAAAAPPARPRRQLGGMSSGPLLDANRTRAGAKPFDPVAFNLGVPQAEVVPPDPIQRHLGQLHGENMWLSDRSRARRADVVGRMVPTEQQRMPPWQLGQHPTERMNGVQAGHPEQLPAIPSGGTFAPGALPGPLQPATPQPTNELWDAWRHLWWRKSQPMSQPAGDFTAVPDAATLKAAAAALFPDRFRSGSERLPAHLRLAKLRTRRDPDGLEHDAPWNRPGPVKLAESLLDQIKFHAPAIRPLDTAVGAGLGAAGGAATYGARRLLGGDDSDKEPEKRRMGLLGHAAVGAGLGAVGGNVVGDRTRRYVSNRMIPFGYGAFDNAKQMLPKSFTDFYESAISDKPKAFTPEVHKELRKEMHNSDWDIEARRELLRRSMGLPLNSGAAEPIFRDAGKTQFEPTKYSGGLSGEFPALEFNPKRWAAQHKSETDAVAGLAAARSHEAVMRRWPSQLPAASAAVAAAAKVPGAVPGLDQPITNAMAKLRRGYDTRYKKIDGPVPSSAYAPFDDILARHGTDFDHQHGVARVSDLWDFGLTPGETKQLPGYLKDTAKDVVTGGTGMSQPVPDYEANTTNGKWDGIPGMTGVPTRARHRNNLLQRWILNTLLLRDGGPVVSQQFDMQPKLPAPLYGANTVGARSKQGGLRGLSPMARNSVAMSTLDDQGESLLPSFSGSTDAVVPITAVSSLLGAMLAKAKNGPLLDAVRGGAKGAVTGLGAAAGNYLAGDGSSGLQRAGMMAGGGLAGNLVGTKLWDRLTGDDDTEKDAAWRLPRGLFAGVKPAASALAAKLPPLAAKTVPLIKQVPQQLGAAARTAAGVPAGQSFGDAPVRNTAKALALRGVAPMRWAGNAALGIGAVEAGAAVKDVAWDRPNQTAERLAPQLGVSPEQQPSLAWLLRRHAAGAAWDAYKPSALRAPHEQGATADMQRTAIHDAVKSQLAGGGDNAERPWWKTLLRYRTPAHAASNTAAGAAWDNATKTWQGDAGSILRRAILRTAISGNSANSPLGARLSQFDQDVQQLRRPAEAGAE